VTIRTMQPRGSPWNANRICQCESFETFAKAFRAAVSRLAHWSRTDCAETEQSASAERWIVPACRRMVRATRTAMLCRPHAWKNSSL
jgi:hypothetical protein